MANMVEQSLICKALDDNNIDILTQGGIKPEMFLTCGAEVRFILNHYSEYKQMPDKTTLLSEFKDFQMLEVEESTDYLTYKVKEAYIYTKLVPIIEEGAVQVKNDSIKGLEFIEKALRELKADTPVTKNKDGYDLVSNSKDRLAAYKDRCEAKGLIGIPTGIPQLDEITNGWLRGEELVVITGRTNVGKSWLGEYFALMAWQMGNRVLYYSGEMSLDILGFRFDTLNKHFSNLGLLNGAHTLGAKRGSDDNYTPEDYEAYINDLSEKEGFIVTTPDDYGGRKPTADELKALAVKVDAQMIVVDQLSLMSDQRGADIMRIAYGNITEDLFLMSKELKIPVLLLAQANRESVKGNKKGLSPELHELAESDTVGQNATRVLSLSVTKGTLKIAVKKNRYGLNNKDVLMVWDTNLGVLEPLIKESEKVEGDKTKEEKKYDF